MKVREFWYKGNKIAALRIIENLSIDNKKSTDYLLCKNSGDESMLLDLKEAENLIPCELYKGDRIMIFNHGKLHGITSISDIENGCAIIKNIPPYMHSDFIPAKVDESGLVMKARNSDVEIYIYHPVVCNRFGFNYNKNIENFKEDGETIISKTSNGDKSVINIQEKRTEDEVSIYVVTTDVYTKYPEEYGLDFMRIAEDDKGNFIIRSKHQYQYKTWMLLAEKIKGMHENRKGDK